ncbi:MAG: hypothetical protein MZU97_00195 [Bacillus subtilis]|nr:hypothetical protein [Bacillus subtilis]
MFGFVTQVDANMVGIVYDPFKGVVQDATLSKKASTCINPFQTDYDDHHEVTARAKSKRSAKPKTRFTRRSK